MADETTTQTVSGQGIADKALAFMKLASGKKYLYGGKTTDGFDCSGFVTFVFSALFPNKVSSLFLTAGQYATTDLFEDVDPPQAGDIIIFPAEGGNPNHIGIMTSADAWVGSQSSTGVAVVLITNTWWGKRTKKFRRLKSFSTASLSLGFGKIAALA